jgi:hypothetical protein
VKKDEKKAKGKARQEEAKRRNHKGRYRMERASLGGIMEITSVSK